MVFAVWLEQDCHLSVYSEHGAGIMARAWCHRMEYYFNIWVEAAEGYAYTNDDHEAYTEPSDFEASLPMYRAGSFKGWNMCERSCLAIVLVHRLVAV